MKMFFQGHGGTGNSVPAEFPNQVHGNLPPLPKAAPKSRDQDAQGSAPHEPGPAFKPGRRPSQSDGGYG
jgi:hypothetical protein